MATAPDDDAPLAIADPETYAYQEGKKAGRKEAIADVLRFLRGIDTYYKETTAHNANVELARSAKISLLRLIIADIKRGRHEAQP